MSDHHCHVECECMDRDWTLDIDAIHDAAEERGVALPVMIEAVEEEIEKAANWPPGYPEPGPGEYIGGTAGHWSPEPHDPIELHVIRVRVDIPAREAIEILLHEIEHCVQSEAFPTNQEWRDDYQAGVMEWEALADAAQEDWLDYGHLLTKGE